ncbi:pentapeptide repeat-containing protein [Anabaena azotica]|uniref:pentapeptide repeat-containing protein n=1 Tax=Anabaena azotica TaxID=197653 RepID=UPI0039A50735
MISYLGKSSDRRSKTAIRKIASFEKRFGQAHLYLAYHAAFPLALTPDLLYRLWANFQLDINGKSLDLPWIAVSDILLSGLCQEVGQELYEMDEAVRDELLKRLQADEKFGQRRIQELSDFLLEYVRKQLQSNDIDVRDFAQAQQWTVLAYTKPGKAAREMALAFQQLGLDATGSGQADQAELVRMASLVKTFAEPLAEAGLEPLLVYARGMDSWARGKLEQAAEHLAKVTQGGKIQIAGVDLLIPDVVQNHSEKFTLPADKDYSGQNLRGRSFKGQDLTGANFSKADIRSTDFTNAILTGANFSGAKTGLQRRWATGIIFFSLFLVILSGVITTLIASLTGFGLVLTLDNLPLNKTEEIIYTFSGSIGFLLFLILCLTTLKKNLKSAWSAGALALFGAFLFVASLIFPLMIAWGWVDSNSSNIIFPIAAAEIALVSVLVLTRVMTGKILSWWMALAVVAVTSVLTVAFLMGQPPLAATVIAALAVIATILVLYLIWIGNWVKRLSRILMIIGIFALLVSLTTGVILIVNQVAVGTIAWAVPLAAILAIVVVIPFIIPASASVSGAFIGTLIVPIAIAIFCSLYSVNSFLDSIWIGFIGILDISIFTAILAWATIITIAVTVNLTWAEADNKKIAIVWTLVGTMPLIVGAAVIALSTIPWLPALNSNLWSFQISVVIGTIVAISILLMGIYIGWRALVKDEKFTSIRDLAITFVAKGGTSFRGSDLTDANFTEAILKNADFTGANLTRTRWVHAQKLDLACVGDSYLQFPQVQQLVITGIAQDQNFDYLNLQGLNLQHMYLEDASFIGTNLSESNLRHTNLSRAKLIKTQLDQADLFGACLTGAYIQDMKITSATKLKGIDCEYIFTRLPTQENRDPGRIPENYHQIFYPGEFMAWLSMSKLGGAESS